MIQLSGIFSESLGGTCTIRGYAKYNEIVELSYPHPGYQRPAEDEHVAEISSFITSGSNSFSPEVVLAYTAKYNYYAQGASSEVDALADIRSGKGFTSNVDGIAFKKEKAAGNGFLYTLSIPDKKYDRIEDKPFRRVDGNHRLLAIEKLIAEGQMRSNYLIPFCIIVFPDNVSMKDEKIIFHNINSKAVPIRSERLLALYYNIEISSPSADAVQYKDRLLTWSEKYQITDAQIDTEQNAASNAECIEAIFNRYVRSTEQTIFMSRCFSAEYNETENAIRRAINEINNEKKTGIMLIRVDEHHEGTTGQISDRIFRDIESAGLVIADLSSGKLNVPHEIGYAMGLKKDLILVHNGTSEEAEKHIPSNIRMFEQIRFNGDYQTLQNEIKRRLIDYYKL